MKRFLILSMLVLPLLTVFASASDGQADGLDAILKQFPEYHVLRLQERDANLRAFFAQKFPKSNPSVVRADLKGDGNTDYALLLKNEKTRAAKLVVFLCAADGQCKSAYEVDETTYASVVYLSSVSMGSTVSQTKAIPGDTSPVKLRSTGIQVNYFEKGKVVLYWDPKRQKIEELQTSE